MSEIDVCDHIAGMNSEHVMMYAQKYLELEIKMNNILSDISVDDQVCIAEYIKFSDGVSKRNDIFKKLDFLISATKYLSNFVKTDAIAMRLLAHDDPGAYAKMLAYRRKSITFNRNLGEYSENHLLSYIDVHGPKKDLAEDHVLWMYRCESRELEAPSCRVSERIDLE